MLHKAIPAGDIHTVANWEVADASALAALVPVSGDDGKIAWRQDNNALYILANYSGPTWAFLGSGSVPGTHASTHVSGGSDSIKLDDLAAPDDNTDLNASTSAHGLLVKATAPSAGLINVVGIANAETAYTNKALFDATTPAALAAAAATGSATVAARRDHVHAVPKIDDLAAADDNTDLNVSTTAHGLAPKLSNVATEYLNGTGAYSVPAGNVAADAIWDAAGDLAVGTGENTAAKLTMGSALQVLRVNAGATALEYADAGSGTVTNTGGNLTANSVVLGAGTVDTKVVAGVTTDGTSQLVLGVNATSLGSVKLFGNTSGDVTISPAAVAGTATALTLPATSGTLALASGVGTTTPVCIQVAASDETTDLTVADGKVVFRAPYAFTLTAVRASVTTAPTGGTLLTVDITESGTTVLSTLLTFDAGEKTTTTATTPAVISDSAIADDAEISINVDAVGSTIAGAGLKVTLIGTKP